MARLLSAAVLDSLHARQEVVLGNALDDESDVKRLAKERALVHQLEIVRAGADRRTRIGSKRPRLGIDAAEEAALNTIRQGTGAWAQVTRNGKKEQAASSAGTGAVQSHNRYIVLGGDNNDICDGSNMLHANEASDVENGFSECVALLLVMRYAAAKMYPREIVPGPLGLGV